MPNCLTTAESKQEILSKISENVKSAKQIGYVFPEKIISEIRFWLNENIDCFEKLHESEKIKLMDGVTQLRLTISIVEQWLESQIGRGDSPKDDIEIESTINATNPSTFKS